MSTTSPRTGEVENNRLEQARAFSEESGEGWDEEYRPGSAGCHELLDRTALMADMLERHLVGHPACVAKPEWYRLAQLAAEALHELYQRVGEEHLSAQEANGERS